MSKNVAQKETKPFIRNRNSRLRVRVEEFDTPDDAKTQQQFAAECDMNRIVANANKGIPPRHLARGTPQYGDFVAQTRAGQNLAEAHALVQNAQEAFLRLPAQLRLELDNDPANLSNLTQDQITRFKLGKTQPSPATPPEAVQADPQTPKTAKAESKKSDKTDP